MNCPREITITKGKQKKYDLGNGSTGNRGKGAAI